MLSFSEYSLLEQQLVNYPDVLDEGFWELMGKLTSKKLPKEKMEKDVLKVNQLRDPKKIADALNPSNPLHVVHAAAKHPDLPKEAMESGSKDTRHHKSIALILKNRLESMPQSA